MVMSITPDWRSRSIMISTSGLPPTEMRGLGVDSVSGRSQQVLEAQEIDHAALRVEQGQVPHRPRAHELQRLRGGEAGGPGQGRAIDDLVHLGVEGGAAEHGASDIAIGHHAGQPSIGVDDQRDLLAAPGHGLEDCAQARPQGEGAAVERGHQAPPPLSAKRFWMRRASSWTVRRTSTMRGTARPSPYGLAPARARALKAGVCAVSMPRRISSRAGSTSITLAPRRRPRWRAPIFTAGSPNDGASMRPLEELPIITSA